MGVESGLAVEDRVEPFEVLVVCCPSVGGKMVQEVVSGLGVVGFGVEDDRVRLAARREARFESEALVVAQRDGTQVPGQRPKAERLTEEDDGGVGVAERDGGGGARREQLEHIFGLLRGRLETERVERPTHDTQLLGIADIEYGAQERVVGLVGEEEGHSEAGLEIGQRVEKLRQSCRCRLDAGNGGGPKDDLIGARVRMSRPEPAARAFHKSATNRAR